MKPREPRTFLFNFVKEFADNVASGKKRQTIRATRADGRVPRPGDIAKLYNGLRTRQTLLLRKSEVTDCFAVQIDLGKTPHIILRATKLSTAEAQAFAIDDGFSSLNEFYAFFRKIYGDYFEGFCIQWKVE